MVILPGDLYETEKWRNESMLYKLINIQIHTIIFTMLLTDYPSARLFSNRQGKTPHWQVG